jgi:CIC family chloride channel protein
MMKRVTASAATVRFSGLRSYFHASGPRQLALAIVVGVLAGASVTAMTRLAEFAHVRLYGLAFDERLSARASVSPWAAFASLGLGGLALGLMDQWRWKRKAPATVDPIEANALRGGRLAFRDGITVMIQTLISNGCGASVGLEAGYAQVGSTIASRAGLALGLRRQDLRTLVGCGAGGAIAGAFGAPLTGAFYAFELIVGAYTLSNAGPIVSAALAADLTVKALGGAPYFVTAPPVSALTITHHFALVGLGLLSAAIGIGTMRGAALAERSFQNSGLPLWARPAAGGCVLAILAIGTPQVLGAGHGALGLDVLHVLTASTLIGLIMVKLTACLISLGSGFRGGLFFASIFVGALLGKLYALAVGAAFPHLALDPTACVFTGMGTLGVAIVGGPMTMTFLVLESSDDLGVAGGVLAACIATSAAVRATFGYSFSTWRLHLRGETIRGALDVGWMRDLTVARLMDRDPPLAPAAMILREFRASHPLDGAEAVILTADDGSYAGLVFATEAHAPLRDTGLEQQAVSAFARIEAFSLRPDDTVQGALSVFASAKSHVLAVTDPETGAPLGLLAESSAARRWAEAAAGALGEA